MSDFASLLSDLKRTANNNNKNNININGNGNQKRKWNPGASTASNKSAKVKNNAHQRNDLPSKRTKQITSQPSSSTPSLTSYHPNHTSVSVRRAPPPRDASQLGISISFLCIGAQKAGTTWLDEMLRKIPNVALPFQQKEVHFWDWHRSKGLGWYTAQWNGVGKDDEHELQQKTRQQQQPLSSSSISSSSSSPLRIYGEVTPCYAVLPDGDIQEIRTLFPRVRLIFMARDLVDRAWSAMLMELRNSMLGLQPGQFQDPQKNDNKSCSDDSTSHRQRNAVLQQLERDADPDKYDDEFFMNRLRHSTHASRSDYALSLRRWLSYFPKEQLLIVPYTQLVEDPRQLLCQCLQHVRVPNATTLVEALDEEYITKRINANVLVKPLQPSLRIKMEQYLQPMAREFNVLLQELGYNDWKLDEYDVKQKVA